MRITRFAVQVSAVILLAVQVVWAEVPKAELLWGPARVADAEDRAYEPAAIALIDGAASSVVLAMYLIQTVRMTGIW
ncbi:MAG: hypothetical protein HY600_01115 [Candidatus Omnitrophica bacterium]|nr:hypothetical protein [Candidatus Omnitrophota bacterium]